MGKFAEPQKGEPPPMFRSFSNRVRKSDVVRWFALFYLLVSVIAGTHEHRHGLLLQSHRTVSAPSSALTAVPAAADATQLTASERDCPVCSFLAHLVSPAIVPQVTCLPLLTVEAPALPLTTKPFVPYRFCARSSSRAPPTLV